MSPLQAVVSGAVGALSTLALAACGNQVVPKPHAAAEAHAIFPLPVCVSQADEAARKGWPAGDLVAWQLVFPTLAGRPSREILDRRLVSGSEHKGKPLQDCTGTTPSTALTAYSARPSVRDTPLTWAEPNKSGLRAVWLRTHHAQNAQQAGPLAVLGRGPHPSEVFALGLFAGDESTRLEIITFGGRLFVVALYDGCSRLDHDGDCVTRMDLLSASSGRLKHLGSVDLQGSGEPISPESAAATERFSTTHHLEPSGIRLHEVLVARDELGRELRRAERDRFVDVLGERLEETAPPLWRWVAPESPVETTPVATTPVATAPTNQGSSEAP